MIGAVVLGAGESRRMGQSKLLLPFGGRTVIEHIVEELQDSEVHEILVVVGHEPEGIRDALEGKPVRIVENPDYSQGMLSSIRCGLRALSPHVAGALIVLGDQPSISSDLVDRLIYAFRGTEMGIVVPKYGNRRGHPLLIARKLFPDVLTSFDDVGLRGLFEFRWKELFELPSADPAVLSDMDTPEEYQRELDRANGTKVDNQ